MTRLYYSSVLVSLFDSYDDIRWLTHSLGYILDPLILAKVPVDTVVNYGGRKRSMQSTTERDDICWESLQVRQARQTAEYR